MRLLSDQPLAEGGKDDRKDSLGFRAYAKAIAESITGVAGPFTIGVFGGWGCGKTSLLRLVQREVDPEPNVVTLWFNAWQYEQEAHPLVPLVRLLAESAESNKPVQEATRSAIKRLAAGLRGILRSLKLTAEVSVPLVGKVGVESSVKDGAESEEQDTARVLDVRTLPSAVFEELSRAALLNESMRVVVFVDDLDRCTPPKALAVLESIKLVLAHPGFIFVLGVANRVIERYLEHRFRGFGIDGPEGDRYLDKLVQLQFQVPPAGDRMISFVDTLFEQLGAERAERLRGLAQVIRVASRQNPRSAIRFVNQLLVDSRISDLVSGGSSHAVELAFFAVTRALQSTWPDVYRSLMATPPLCEAIAGWTPEDLTLDRVLPGTKTDSGEDDGRRMKQRLFQEPDLRQILFSAQGRAWLRDRSSREAASDFVLRSGPVTPSTPERTVTYDAFLSYRMSDRDKVRRVAQKLIDADLKVMWDEVLQPGANWRQGLDQSLVRSRSLVFFVGPDTPHSEWQSRELEMGLRVAARDPAFHVYPILLPGADKSALAEAVRERIWVDLQTRFDDDRRLAEALKPLIGQLKGAAR